MEAEAGVERLEAHVRDLESRKRAPLYQKKQVRACVCVLCRVFVIVLVGGAGGRRRRPGSFNPPCKAFIPLAPPHTHNTHAQEAELQAALDKATEAEARASEAEVRMKKAKASVLGGAKGAGARQQQKGPCQLLI